MADRRNQSTTTPNNVPFAPREPWRQTARAVMVHMFVLIEIDHVAGLRVTTQDKIDGGSGYPKRKTTRIKEY